MTWIDAIVSNLLNILKLVSPLRIIRVYQRGVVFRLGIVHRVMEPGIRWMWPFKYEECELVYVAEQAMNLLSQSVTTHDDVPVTFSVNIVLVITDPVLYYTAVHDFDSSVRAYSMTHLAAKARDWTWPELLEGQKKLEDSLKGTLSTRLAKWGGEVVSVGFTDLVRAKPFRMFGDPQSLKAVGLDF